jgi:hypothetical protein
MLFGIKSLPMVYRIISATPNVMLTNVMACRVFRNTKFRNQCIDPTIGIPSIPVHEPHANSSATPALGGNQSPRGWGAVEGVEVENGDVIEIYSPPKSVYDLEEGSQSSKRR